MAAYATVKLYAYIASAWTELVNVAPLRISWGMSSNSPIDRIADPGELTVALNNDSGQYTPGGPNALAGWKKGIPFKVVFTFEGEDYVRFRGIVDDIEITRDNQEKKAYVTVVDWLDYAAKHPIVNPDVATNQRGDQVITTAVALVATAPQATDYDTGIETFETAFDTTTSHTKVYNELSKVAFSELGYVYLKKDKTNGETLVFEAQDARPGSRTVDLLPVASADTGKMLKEDSGYLLLETGDRILLNQYVATAFTSANISDFEAPYGDHVINRMTVYAYPRRLSASPEVLFSLDKEIIIGSGKAYTLKGTYIDPNGGLPINGKSMITPVATTDYTMYTATGGGGTNITGSLTVSITYGTEGFTAILTNGNTSTGYVNFFRTRGTGIYYYNPIENVATNSASITEFETESETLHQKYQNTLYTGRWFVDSKVEEYKQPRTVLNSITFPANKSAAAMMAFLNGDVGQLHYIDIDELGLTGNYYIQGIEVQMQGKIIWVTWIVVAALSLLTGCGLTPVAVEFAGGSATDGVNFGPLPPASNLRQRTISAWIYMDTDVPDATYYSVVGYGVNYLFIIKQNRKIKLYDQQTGVSGAGAGDWTSTNSNVIPLSAWTHVLVTHNTTAWPSSSVPIIYVNGSTVALTENTTPSGNFGTETGLELVIGNAHSADNNYSDAFDGKIFDVRIYNRILTSAEVTTLYNSGTPSASVGSTNGLVFQAFAVRTGDTASYINQTLTSSTNLSESQLKAVGFVNGAPVGRAAP